MDISACRCFVPDAAANEVMKLVVADVVVSRRHGLNAFAIPSADQPRNVSRTHPTPRLVSNAAVNDKSHASSSLSEPASIASLHKSWLSMDQ